MEYTEIEVGQKLFWNNDGDSESAEVTEVLTDGCITIQLSGLRINALPEELSEHPMEKFTVTVYQETYSTYEIFAETKEDADAIVWSGEVDPTDVTVKESEIID